MLLGGTELYVCAFQCIEICMSLCKSTASDESYLLIHADHAHAHT